MTACRDLRGPFNHVRALEQTVLKEPSAWRTTFTKEHAALSFHLVAQLKKANMSCIQQCVGVLCATICRWGLGGVTCLQYDLEFFIASNSYVCYIKKKGNLLITVSTKQEARELEWCSMRMEMRLVVMTSSSTKCLMSATLATGLSASGQTTSDST